MSKISRNAPCPCGSGKKYKKCCLLLPKDVNVTLNKGISISDFDDLDDLSNKVLDLIKMEKIDDAENCCHKLISLYPDQIDGIDRMAFLYETKGEMKKAMEYYRKAAAFAQSMPGFEQESIDWYLMKADALDDNGK